MITIEHMHSGPIGRGHGGAAAGRFAELIDPTAATVRLHAPIPLDSPMRSLQSATRANVYDGDDHIATVRPLEQSLLLSQYGRLPEHVVDEAEHRWLDASEGVHMAPTCFACGHERARGGFGLRPGPVADSALFATRWTPDGPGPVAPWLVWAALDCPTGFSALASLGPAWAALTGELAVEIYAPVHGEFDYQLISRRRETDGRKILTEAALVDPTGRTVAAARATWIAVPLAMVRPDLANAA